VVVIRIIINTHIQFFIHTQIYFKMKKRFFNITSAAALLLAVGLTGCSRENAKDENAPRNVLLKLELTSTRAVADPIAANTQTPMSGGYVIFSSANGTITKKLEINYTAYDSDASPTTVTITQLTQTNGISIVDISPSTTEVHVFSNLPTAANGTIGSASTLAACKEAVLTPADLYNSAGNVSAVPLYGVGSVEDDPNSAVLKDMCAAVPVYPVAGRIEIAEISCDATITTFQVLDVFVNYYYEEMHIDGTIVPSTVPQNLGSDGTLYVYASTGQAYYNKPELHDVVNGAAGTSTTFGGGKVLAYNLLANNVANNANPLFPHIIIKMKVTPQATGTEVTKYLTVTNVVDAGVTQDATNYLPFQKAKVYGIENIVFGATDLFDDPEPGVINLRVKVTVQSWLPVAVDAVF
jgi:hypothetical protein